MTCQILNVLTLGMNQYLGSNRKYEICQLMQIVRLKISIRNKQETEFFDALTSMCTLALNEGIKRRLLQEELIIFYFSKKCSRIVAESILILHNIPKISERIES